jgi:hypothetical protein
MADRVMYVNGNPIKLIDNGDGTYSEGSTGVLRQRQVGDNLTFAFAHSANANTQKTATVAKPANPLMEYQLIIYNPSTTSDITVKLLAVEEDLGGEGVDVEVLIDSFIVQKAQAVSGTTISAYAVNLVGALFNGSNLKIVVSNNEALAADGGFTATVRIREVG